MNINRPKLASATAKGVLALFMILFFSVGTAQATQLTNTGVTASTLETLFSFSFTDTSSYSDYLVSGFDFDGDFTDDGQIMSGVVEGSGDTLGYYFYFYMIDYYDDSSVTSINSTDTDSPYRITELTLGFGGYASLDLDELGRNDSYWVQTNPQDNWPNAGVYLIGDDISFDFFCCNIIDPDETSTWIGAVSTNDWHYTEATISIESGATTTTAMVIAPVPEPSTLLLLGTAMIGAGILLRRRNKESQLGL